MRKKSIVLSLLAGLLAVTLFYSVSPAPAYAASLLQDDFQDGNYTSPAWTPNGGTWAVITDPQNSSNKVLRQSNTTQEAFITAGSSSWKNYSYSANIRNENAYPGILARYADNNNYYMFRLLPVSSNTVELSKVVGGTSTILATKTDFTMDSNTWYTLRIVVSGSSIKCYIGTALIFDITDASLTSGKVGIRSKWGIVDVDDAAVSEIEMGAAATPFVLKNGSSVNNVKLQWSSVGGAAQYTVSRSVNGGSYTALQSLTGLSIDDYGLAAGSTYTYRVQAYSGSTLLASAVSNAVSPYALPAGLNTFDNTVPSSLVQPNPLKIGNTYYKFANVSFEGTRRFKETIMTTSTDDITYGNPQVVMSYTDHPDLNDCKFESSAFVYNPATNKIVYWAHYENSADYTLARLSVASATPGQAFTFHKSFQPMQNRSLDMSLYTADDGSAYIISSAGTDTILYKLSANWLDVANQEKMIYDGLTREAPSMIKKDGIFYLFTSQQAGWYPTIPMYSSAPLSTGPWTELRRLGNTSTFSAQSGGVTRLKKDTGTNYAMLANRWMAGWKGAADPNHRQRMLPLSFSNGYAFFDFYEQVKYSAANDIMIPVQNGKLLSQGKPATASTNSSTANLVNDGDYDTRWLASSNTAWPSYWTVDLGAPCNLSNIQISWYLARGSEAYYRYKIEGSNNGSTFTTVLDKTSGYTDYGFTNDVISGSYRYVRVTLANAVLQNNPSNWYTPQLYEVKVFGTN